MKEHVHPALVFIVAYMVNGNTATEISQDDRFEGVTKSPHFVDKTILLRDLIDELGPVLITCPDGFGKSTNLDMARRFFQAPFDETTGQKIDKQTTRYYRLFTDTSLNLKIAQDKSFVEKHCGEYPVIHLDFDNTRGNTTEQIIRSIAQKVTKVIHSYRWLYEKLKEDAGKSANSFLNLEKVLNINPAEHISVNCSQDRVVYAEALKTVSLLLTGYFDNKLIALIDNYDAPITQAIVQGQDARQVYDFTHTLLSVFAERGEFSCISMIAGVQRLFYGSDGIVTIYYNYFQENDNTFGRHFGLLTDEVDGLLAAKNVHDDERKKVKDYFNGYRVHIDEAVSLYYTKGVLHYLETQTVDDHAISHNPLISKIFACLRQPEFFHKITVFLRNDKKSPIVDFHMCKRDLDELVQIVRNNCTAFNFSSSYQMIINDNGYLKPDGVGFPNKMMKNKFIKQMRNFYTQYYGIEIANYDVNDTLHKILNSSFTTRDMVHNLTIALQQLVEPKRSSGFTEFEFQSVIFATYYYFFSDTYSRVRIEREDRKYENTIKNHLDMLMIPNLRRSMLLIIKVTFNKQLKNTLKDVASYVPDDPYGDRTPYIAKKVFRLVKYIAINMNENYQVEIAKDDNREVISF